MLHYLNLILSKIEKLFVIGIISIIKLSSEVVNHVDFYTAIFKFQCQHPSETNRADYSF